MNGGIPLSETCINSLLISYDVAADKAGLSGQRELKLALGQRQLGFLAFADIDGHVHDADDRRLFYHAREWEKE